MTVPPDFDDELLAEIENLRHEIDILRMAMLDMEHRNIELEAVNTVAAALNRSLELQEVVDVALESTITALQMDCGVLCLYDPSSRSFMPATDRQAPDEIIGALASFGLGEGPAGVVGESRSPLIIPDLDSDQEHQFPAAVAAGLPFFTGIPIAADDELLGVMVLLDAKVGRISADWLVPLGRMGDLMGRAMANAQVLRKAKQEIVERMMGDKELRRLMAYNQEKLRLTTRVLDALPFALVVLGPDGDELLSNAVAEARREELLLADDEGNLSSVAGVGTANLRGRKDADPPLRSPLATRPLEIRTRVLLQRENDAAASAPLLVTIHDADEQSSSEPLMAAEASRAGTSAAPVAPPLFTMLGMVELYATMALGAEELSETTRHLVQNTASGARCAAGIARKLRDAAGEGVIARRPVSVAKLVRELEAELAQGLDQEVAMRLQSAEDELLVNADPSALEQILRNLVANATAAMPRGGELVIAVGSRSIDAADEAWQPPLPPGHWVEVKVSDSGDGIPPELWPRVFEPFVSSQRAEQGRGLGLAQARGLARQHGGHLALAKAEGKGTEALLLLPALAAPGIAAEPAAVAELVRGHNEAVMVIESDAIARAALARAAEELGYRALEASGAPEAMTVFHRFTGRISAILVEELPETDTLSLLHELRRLYPSSRAILMPDHEVDPGALQNQGWHDWVPKPPQLWELSLVLARAVTKR